MMTITQPSIWIADLAAYNAGILHGEWVKLSPDTTREELYATVARILAEGTRLYGAETCSDEHEEFAIHDYEGFGSIRIGEYDSLDTVLGHVERLGGEPRKYEAWISARGESDAENYDPDRVRGPYESEEAYLDEWIEDSYGSLDIEAVLIGAGVDGRAASSLAGLLHWVSPDQFMRDSGNPLVEIPTGDYSVEFFEVEQ